MTLFQVVVLALIQGITEFLPISSSAHLILPAQLLGWPDQGLAFDVAVHVGTLAAVLWYFRGDLHTLAVAWGRSCLVIAITTIVFGLLLGVADRRGSRRNSLADLNWRGALWIGLAQALALIPGTSRSGITMTAALALGFDRVAAARFSFLLSIPIITLSGLFKGVALLCVKQVPWASIGLATGISALTAYLCIRVFLNVINRVGMMPFVWYRLLLGGVLLVVIGLS